MSQSFTTTNVADNAITNAKLRDSAATSVVGRSANSTGDPADIAASTDGQVLRRSASVLGFGAVDLADADAVTGVLPAANLASTVALLPGRAGGQTLQGDTAASGNLMLQSTAHATKGKVLFGTSAYDEVNNRLGIGTASPSTRLHVVNTDATAVDITLANTLSAWALRNNTAGNFNFIDNAGNAIFILTTGAPLGAFRVDASGNVGVGVGTFGTSAAKVLAIFNGTAPTTGPADTVQFYSSDDAAGHTVPSFFCEGTNVVATGQADSASSVRVKMRINGTVRTFLCI